MSTETEALRECPFCGGPAEIDHIQAFRRMADGCVSNQVAIYCTKCDANMSACYNDLPTLTVDEIANLVRENWNRRASLASAGKGKAHCEHGILMIKYCADCGAPAPQDLMKILTDDMVEKGAAAMMEKFPITRDTVNETMRIYARACLAAVLPDVIERCAQEEVPK